MKKEEVELTVSQLKEELLGNNLTWYKKDDMGFGSVQEKYGASDLQIATIMKHPKLVGVEPNCKVFIVRDDTEETKEMIKRFQETPFILVNNEKNSFGQGLDEFHQKIKEEQGSALIEL